MITLDEDRMTFRFPQVHPEAEDHLMATAEKLRSLTQVLAGEAWDYEGRQQAAQAYVHR